MTLACADCGALQRLPPLDARSVASCARCRRFLDRDLASSLGVALAGSSALLLLLLPAVLLPILSASMGGDLREVHVVSSVAAAWRAHQFLLALMLSAFTVVLPLVWALLLTVVLACVRLGRRPRWLGPAFRHAQTLRTWALPDVMVLSALLVYARAAMRVDVQVEPGGWCLLAAGFLALGLPAVLAPQGVWRAIAPERAPPRGGSVACGHCQLVLPRARAGRRCPRCRAKVRLVERDAMRRTAALVAASYLLVLPAYYYAMGRIEAPTGVRERTILHGMLELYRDGLWHLGTILLVASVLIPVFKLSGLSWLMLEVRHPTRRHLRAKTRIHRLIHGIGRWGFVDPLVVTLSMALLSFPGFLEVHAGRALLPFSLIVTLTMLGSRCFDPRLLWEGAEEGS